METELTIQEVAKRTGLSIDTLHYYERIGLIFSKIENYAKLYSIAVHLLPIEGNLVVSKKAIPVGRHEQFRAFTPRTH